MNAGRNKPERIQPLQYSFPIDRLSLFENAPDCILLTDPRGTILYSNSKAREISGYAGEELIGKSISSLYQLASLSTRPDGASSTNLMGRNVAPDCSWLTGKDGTRVPVEIRTAPVIENGQAFDIVFIRDISSHRQMAERLIKSQSNYRLLAENAGDVIWTTDMDLKATYFSPSVIRLLGFSVEQAMSRPMAEAFTPASFDLAMKVFAEELAIERQPHKDLHRTRTLEIELVHKNGSVVTAEIKYSFLRNAAEKPVGILANVRDINDRKRVEAALAASDERLRLALDATRDGVWDWDIINDTHFYSPRWCEIMGYREDDPGLPDAFETFISRIHPEDYERVLKALKSHLETGSIYDVEYRHKNKAGEYRWHNSRGRAIFDVNSKPLRMVGCVRDITHRVRAEESLRESEEKYRTLFKHMINGYAFCKMIFGPDGKPENFVYLDVNDAFEKISGFKRENITGRKASEVIPNIKEVNPDYLRIYGEVAATGKPATFEILFKPRDRWMHISAYSPQHGYFVAIMDDITERKRAEEKITHLASFPELNPNPVCETDRTGKINYMNPAARQLFPSLSATHDYLRDWPGVVRELGPEKTIVREIQMHGKWYEQVITVVSEDQVRIYGRDVKEHREAEEAVKTREEKYRSLVNNLKLGIYRGAPGLDGKILEVNPALELITGYSRAELIGMPASVLFANPDERMRSLEATVKYGRTTQLLKFRRKDGSEITVSNTRTAVFADDGTLKYFDGIVEDITERKKLEEDLRIKARLLEEAIDSVFCYDLDGNFTYVNEAAYKTRGYTRDELFSLGMIGLHTPPCRGLVPGRINELIEKGSATFESSYINKDGTFMPVETHALLLESEGRPLILSVVRDITRRKRVDALMEILANSSPVGVALIQDGTIVYVNHRMEQQIGYTREDIIGTEPKLYIVPEDREKVREHNISVLKSGIPAPFECRVMAKSGEVRWMLETVVATDYREKPAVLVNFLDVTELRALEKRVIEYKELDKIKTDLLSVVSHELRTPLTIIKGYSEMLLTYHKRLAREERERYLGAIDAATERLTRHVDKLLDVTRLDAGLINLELSRVNLSEMISVAASEARLRAPDYRVITKITGELPALQVDPVRIRQVLDNLIDNACKYSDEGTDVTISAVRHAGEVHVSVTDQGVGIAGVHFSQLFTRMTRIENRRTKLTDGLGLGLFICKGLVEAHHGRIWVESCPWKGATFTFALPVTEVLNAEKK